MAEKVNKLFVEYEKTMEQEKKKLHDHALVNHEGGGDDPAPFLSSSESYSSSSSRHSNRHAMNAYKNLFFKFDVKFELPMFSGESNAKTLDN